MPYTGIDRSMKNIEPYNYPGIYQHIGEISSWAENPLPEKKPFYRGSLDTSFCLL
jgi:hypothetical protein